MTLATLVRSVAIVVVAALAPATTMRFGPNIVDPQTYASRDGTWILSVDPTHRDGSGAARYRLARNGATVWEGGRPWTLVHAAVADDGRVAGVAFSHGPSSVVADARLVEVLLDARGAVVLEESSFTDRDPPANSPWRRMASGVFLWPQRDAFVVRLRDVLRSDVLRADRTDGHRESWCVRSLRDGSRILVAVPETERAEREPLRVVTDVRPLEGTPFVVACVEVGTDPREIDVVVLDDRLETVCTASARVEPAPPARGTWMPPASLATPAPRRAALVAPSLELAIEYEIVSAGTGRWSLKERSRSEWRPPSRDPAPVPLVDLRETDCIDLDPHVLVRAPASGGIDSLGHVYLVDGELASVSIYASNGALLADRLSVTLDQRSLRWPIFETRPDGGFAISGRFSRRCAVFDARGNRVESPDLGLERCAFAPDASAAVVFVDNAFVFLDRDRREVARVERTADGRWLRGAGGIAFARDGRVAMFTNPRGLEIRDANGTLLRAIPLPDAVVGGFLAFDGARAVLSGYRSEAFLVDASAGIVQRFELPGAREGESWRFGFDSDGEHLLALTPKYALLLRFALP